MSLGNNDLLSAISNLRKVQPSPKEDNVESSNEQSESSQGPLSPRTLRPVGSEFGPSVIVGGNELAQTLGKLRKVTPASPPPQHPKEDNEENYSISAIFAKIRSQKANAVPKND